MGQEIALRNYVEPAWGMAHPRRGAEWHEAAVAFLKEYPIGRTLSQDTFSEWAERHGHLQVPRDVSIKSDEWLAHLHRRHSLRYNINKAASHPRMIEQGLIAFTIDTIGHHALEVRSVQVAIAKSNAADRFATIGKTKKRQLAHLMQSADWSALPPHDKAFAEALYDDIDDFSDDMERRSTRLLKKFTTLENKLRPLNIRLPPPPNNDDESDGEGSDVY